MKWIDVEKLLLELVKDKFPNATVEKIFIFTAKVKKTPGDNNSERQEVYLQALQEYSPSIEIIFGFFKHASKVGGKFSKPAEWGEVVLPISG